MEYVGNQAHATKGLSTYNQLHVVVVDIELRDTGRFVLAENGQKQQEGDCEEQT